jgi:hypothetical protein
MPRTIDDPQADSALPEFHAGEIGAFRVRGRVVSASGAPLRGVRVVLVDRDLLRDDRIAEGWAQEGGRFHCSFTRGEFNRHLFEAESSPDLDLYFYGRAGADEPVRPLQRISLDVHIEPGDTDLGDLVLEAVGDGLRFADELPMEPGSRGRATIELSPELLDALLREVAPLVQQESGYPIDLGAVRIDVLEGNIEEVLEGSGTGALAEWAGLPGWFKVAIGAFMTRLVAAIYCPLSATIYVNEPMTRQVNLDALKLILAHELVHHGQFTHRPELREQLDEEIGRLGKVLEDDVPTEVLVEAVQRLTRGFKQEIEGEAEYVRMKLWKRYYPCATYQPPTYSVVHKAVMKWAMGSVPGMDRMLREQYTEGLKQYRDRMERGQ